MIDFIDELYYIYCDHNEDIYASDIDATLKANSKEIDKALSLEFSDKLGEIELANSKRAFRCGFSVAMKLFMQGVSV